jgi:hypothetical protein
MTLGAYVIVAAAEGKVYDALPLAGGAPLKGKRFHAGRVYPCPGAEGAIGIERAGRVSIFDDFIDVIRVPTLMHCAWPLDD